MTFFLDKYLDFFLFKIIPYKMNCVCHFVIKFNKLLNRLMSCRKYHKIWQTQLDFVLISLAYNVPFCNLEFPRAGIFYKNIFEFKYWSLQSRGSKPEEKY